MNAESVRYLSLTPTKDGCLSLDDSKQIISSLAKLSSNLNLVIKSKKATGIELIVGIDKSVIASALKHIYSINPQLIVTEIKHKKAHISSNLKTSLNLKRHYALPLFLNDITEESDLLSLMQHLSQISNSQAIELSLKVKPIRSLKSQILRRRLISGANPKLHNPDVAGRALLSLYIVSLLVILSIRTALKLIDNLIFSHSIKDQYITKQSKVSASRIVAVLDKLYDPLFKTEFNLYIKSSNVKTSEQIAKDILLAINSFAGSVGYQSYKMSDAQNKDIYSLTDLSALFHIPKHSSLYALQEFKTLAAPKELVSAKPKDGVILGLNTYMGANNKLILSNQARKQHVYITGATGSGKSTLMANLMQQDAVAGHGLTLIDPHGDLADIVKGSVPKNRINDLIYFDPTDQESQIGLNLLELSSKPGSKDYASEKDQITESLISLFRKVFETEDIASHRIEYILRNSIQTALLIEGSNIFTIFRLLTDSAYRQQIIPRIKDQNLANFWTNELGRAGEYQRVKMTAGITSKVGRFLFSEPAKRVFSKTNSTLDFDDILNNKKILICNFSKGKLGEDGSKLFATTIMTKLQLAALKRVKTPINERTDHYLYLDEFQNYSPTNIVQILTESRKYGLYLTMAEQSPSQQDPYSTSIILANVANLVCFRTASPKDERLLLPNFGNYLTPQDLNNLPSFNFYFKSVGKVVIPPTSGKTLSI